MRIRRAEDAEEPFFALTSLIDILFILITFFLAATSFREEERDVQVSLPRADESAALTSAPRVLVVNVRADGRYVVSNRVTDLPGVAQTVRQAVGGDAQQKVLIRGDRAARHEHVAAAVRACKQAGVVQANIGYDSTPTP